jgi:hypothetical protein
MDNFEKAVETLIAAAGSAQGSTNDTYEGLGAVLEEAERSGEEGRNRALRRLAEVVASTDVTRASLVALGCGALVESGGDPGLALDAILDRLPRIMAKAAVFAELCHDLAESPSEAETVLLEGFRGVEASETKAAEKNDAGGYVDEFGAIVAEEMPEEAQAWTALEPLCMGAIAMLSRSLPARRQARNRAELLARCLEISGQHRRARHLSNLLRVLDDEDLLVFHPKLVRGYRIRIRGIADNFQLHTLLADALIGDPAEGWLPGPRPDPRVVAAARSQMVQRGVGSAGNFFQLIDWRGLQPDGTLSRAVERSDHWIANESVPADIPAFNGTRIILLAPPLLPQTWDANRPFEGMEGDLRVLEVMSPEAVRDWFARIVRSQAGELQ